MTASPRYAGPVDRSRFGSYRMPDPGGRPRYRFAARIGTARFPAEPGRYHLYAGWFCPWAHRATIAVALNGLAGVVSVSYVHGERDGRGWAFRPPTGPDPVAGAELLRELYERSEPGFDGHVSVPVLFDRHAGQVVSNDPATIGVDLATAFRAWSDPDVDTYPAKRRAEIDSLCAWIADRVIEPAGEAEDDPAARTVLRGAFAALNDRLAGTRYLLGERLTEADLHLWPVLVRAGEELGELARFRYLDGYARALWHRPAFAATTDFTAFAATGAPPARW